MNDRLAHAVFLLGFAEQSFGLMGGVITLMLVVSPWLLVDSSLLRQAHVLAPRGGFEIDGSTRAVYACGWRAAAPLGSCALVGEVCHLGGWT